MIFEGQELTNEQFKSAVRYFGEIEIHSFIGKIEDDDKIESLGTSLDVCALLDVLTDSAETRLRFHVSFGRRV